MSDIQDSTNIISITLCFRFKYLIQVKRTFVINVYVYYVYMKYLKEYRNTHGHAAYSDTKKREGKQRSMPLKIEDWIREKFCLVAGHPSMRVTTFGIYINILLPMMLTLLRNREK